MTASSMIAIFKNINIFNLIKFMLPDVNINLTSFFFFLNYDFPHGNLELNIELFGPIM
jgi:hypothetical protein